MITVDSETKSCMWQSQKRGFDATNQVNTRD